MKIIFGLGNPEKKYFNTYHNIGFMFADSLADDLKLLFKIKKAVNSEIAEGIIDSQVFEDLYGIKCKKSNEKIIIVKPHTYMNLSGNAVKAVLKKYGAKLEDIAVVIDDVDLMVGKFRIREHGSAGTHNGLKNITASVASENFMRVRIGINSEECENLLEYVLSNISKENAENIDNAIIGAKKALFERILN